MASDILSVAKMEHASISNLLSIIMHQTAKLSIQRQTIDLLKLENEALRLALERISEGRHE